MILQHKVRIVAALLSVVAGGWLLLSTPLIQAARPVEDSSPLIEIPFTSDHGVPMVQVMINGKGPYSFIVDTGEEHMGVISPKIAAELKLEQAGAGKTTDPTNGREVRGPMFVATTLEFSGFKTGMVQLFGVDVGVDGVIGLPMFREYLCEFRPAENRILLRRGSLSESNGRNVLAYISPTGIPDVELSIANKTVRAHPDTGNPGTISLPKKTTTGLAWFAAPVKVGEAGTIADKFTLYEGQLQTDLHLGQFTFRRPYVVVSEFAGTHANLGFGLFRLFHSVTFDQKNLRVRFESGASTIQLNSLFR